MSSKDARVDAYIVNSADFAKPILRHVRRLVHQACPEVEETMKWSHAFFQYHGLMCSMASFTAHCSIGFWRPEIRELIDGPAASGAADGEAKDGMGQFGRITSLADLPDDAVLIKYIEAAAALNESGKPPAPRRTKTKPPLVAPVYLKRALKAVPKADAAFSAFPPGKQRDYIEWLTEAKTEATRAKRLATAVEWIAEGKSRNWKYEKC